VNQVVQRIIVGEALNGNKLPYQEAYEEEYAKHQTLALCFANSIYKIASYFYFFLIKFDFVVLAIYCCS